MDPFSAIDTQAVLVGWNISELNGGCGRLHTRRALRELRYGWKGDGFQAAALMSAVLPGVCGTVPLFSSFRRGLDESIHPLLQKPNCLRCRHERATGSSAVKTAILTSSLDID